MKLIYIFFVAEWTKRVLFGFVYHVHIEPCEKTVRLLGVELDYQLNFNEQISRICQKVVRQLNVLKRISKFLSEETRLLV